MLKGVMSSHPQKSAHSSRKTLILADEPTGNLDTTTSEEIMTLFSELNRQGITVIIVTHEADIATFTRRRIVFRDGVVVTDELIGAKAAPHSVRI